MCLSEEIPSPYNQKRQYEKIYQRILEIQIEQIETISLLYKEGRLRSAYAILRSLLEGMATLVWMALNIDKYYDTFTDTNKKNPPIKNILDVIGWGDEYERTFQYLSYFVHSRSDHLDFYRSYDSGPDPSQPFPEVSPDSEYYIINSSNVVIPLIIRMMSPEEIQNEHGPFLIAKTFDIVISSIQFFLGSNFYQTSWFPKREIDIFTNLLSENPNLKNKMLFSLQLSLF